MKINLEDTVEVWGTVNDSTGAAVDADSTPTVTVYKNGTAVTGSPTMTAASMTNIASGVYRYSRTLGAASNDGAFAVGDLVSIVATAVVDGVTSKAVLLDERIVASVISADLYSIGSSTQSATDLKDFADTGYDPATHKVQGVVLTDTATNLTNAPTAGDFTATMKASITSAVPDTTSIANAVDAALDDDFTNTNTLVTNNGTALAQIGLDASSANTNAMNAATDAATAAAATAAIQAKTDNLPASPAAVGSAMTLTSAYDAAKTASQAGDAMTLSDGAITAAKIGADAITAAKIATDAITEIQSGLSTLSASDVLSKVNEALDTAIAELGVATPATTPTMRTGLMLLYMHLLNDTEDTQTRRKIKNAAGTVIAQGTIAATTSGDSVTGVSQGKLASP